MFLGWCLRFVGGFLSAQHFRDDENQERTAQSSAQEQIQ